MEDFWALFSDGIKIIVVLMVMISFWYSSLIFFKPQSASRLNARFNRFFSTKTFSRKLDQKVDTTEYLIKRRWFVGLPFFLGAVYTLHYLLVGFDQSRFVSMIIKPTDHKVELFIVMFMDLVQWLLVIWCSVGAALCLIMLAAPDFFMKISSTLDAFFSTEKVEDLIDTSHNALDDWVLKNHILVGFFLFLGSAFLVAFCLRVFY